MGSNSGTISSCYATGYAESSGVAEEMIGWNYGNIINCYYYTQKQYISYGIVATLDELNNYLFYTTGINGKALGWSAEVWILTELDLVNGKLPALSETVPGSSGI